MTNWYYIIPYLALLNPTANVELADHSARANI